MGITFFHEILLINIIYRNNNLFVQWPLGGHVDIWLRFGVVIFLDDLLDVLDVGCLEKEKTTLIFNTFSVLLIFLAN